MCESCVTIEKPATSSTLGFTGVDADATPRSTLSTRQKEGG